jgi:hypothetical protein
MNRLCERPGCSAPAEVAYGFDADLLMVWLDQLPEVLGMRHGVLCRRHGDAMIVPLGWMLDDRREPTLRLFKSAATDAPHGTSSREPRPRVLDLDQLRLEPDDTGELVVVDLRPAVEEADVAPAPGAADAPVPAVPAVAEEPAASDSTHADAQPGWVPVFDPADDLRGLLRARGRLLSRAFNGTQTEN